MVHAGGRAGGGVGIAIERNAVGRDGNAGLGLADGVVDRAVGRLVVGVASEAPLVTRIGASIRVSRLGEVQQAGEVFVVHAGGRAGGGVGTAVEGDRVGRDGDGGLGLADGVIDRAVGWLVVVVTSEAPLVTRVGASIGVGGATQSQQ